MSENKHTPEPWYASCEGGNWRVMAADENGGYTLADMCCDDQEANARRIVAAVNAFSGVGNAWLESMAKAGGLSAVNHYIAVCNQAVSAMTADQERAVLLAEVKRVTACAERSQALYERERDLYDKQAAELSAAKHNEQVMNESFAFLVTRRDELLTELLRVKAICLREFGNGIVNEVVIASVGGHCMCDACKNGNLHRSDCAVHNDPARPNGPCDCGAIANVGQRQNPSNGGSSEQVDAGLVNGQVGLSNRVAELEVDVEYWKGRFEDTRPERDELTKCNKSLLLQRDELLAAMIEAREALQFANDNPGGGIDDTIWMMHRPETLFDFMDSAIASAKGGAA